MLLVLPAGTPAAPPALVMVPPEMVHAYVIPAWAVDRCGPPRLAGVTGLAAVMVGVAAAAITEICVLPWAGSPAALISLQISVSVPTPRLRT